MKVQITLVNATKHYRFYDKVQTWKGRGTGNIYRRARELFGRCESKVYMEEKNGKKRAVEWFFRKDMTYLEKAVPKDGPAPGAEAVGVICMY